MNRLIAVAIAAMFATGAFAESVTVQGVKQDAREVKAEAKEATAEIKADAKEAKAKLKHAGHAVKEEMKAVGHAMMQSGREVKQWIKGERPPTQG